SASPNCPPASRDRARTLRANDAPAARTSPRLIPERSHPPRSTPTRRTFFRWARVSLFHFRTPAGPDFSRPTHAEGPRSTGLLAGRGALDLSRENASARPASTSFLTAGVESGDPLHRTRNDSGGRPASGNRRARDRIAAENVRCSISTEPAA